MESDKTTRKKKKKATENDGADVNDVEVPEIFYPGPITPVARSSNSATAKKVPSRGFKGNTSIKPPAKHPPTHLKDDEQMLTRLNKTPHTQQDSQLSLKMAIRADGTRPTRTKRVPSTSSAGVSGVTNGKLHAGVGTFHDEISHTARQTAEYETAPFESDEEERNTAVEYGKEYGDLAVADAVHDDDAFIPSATQYDPDSKSSAISKHRRFRRYGFAGIYILLVIIVVLSISIAVTRNNRKSDNQISADGSGSQTTFPTPGPTTVREGEGILGELIKISSVEKLNDPNSAQFKAAQWIQFEDPQQLGADADNLLQRYALAVMYFSLQENGPWFFCGANDSSHKDPDLCTGQIAVWIGDPQNPNDNTIYEELEDEAKWLSAKSECVWLGVYCNKDNVTIDVIEIGELFGTAHFCCSQIIWTPVLHLLTLLQWKTTLSVHFRTSLHLLFSSKTFFLT
jgi:hypothetical protein